jgi:hypothetical protein
MAEPGLVYGPGRERRTIVSGRAVVVILSLLMLGACYESPNIAVHEPGKYKGSTDPLLAKERMPQQQETLRQRFEVGQTDR